MRITLLYPIGQHQPNEVIDVDPIVGSVLVREVLARPAGEPIDPDPQAPTIGEVRALATDLGISTKEASRRLAAERQARLNRPRATPAQAGHPAAPI